MLGSLYRIALSMYTSGEDLILGCGPLECGQIESVTFPRIRCLEPAGEETQAS